MQTMTEGTIKLVPAVLSSNRFCILEIMNGITLHSLLLSSLLLLQEDCCGKGAL